MFLIVHLLPVSTTNTYFNTMVIKTYYQFIDLSTVTCIPGRPMSSVAHVAQKLVNGVNTVLVLPAHPKKISEEFSTPIILWPHSSFRIISSPSPSPLTMSQVCYKLQYFGILLSVSFCHWNCCLNPNQMKCQYFLWKLYFAWPCTFSSIDWRTLWHCWFSKRRSWGHVH